MSVTLSRYAPLALVLATAPALSAADKPDTRPVLDRVADLKPAAEDKNDSPIRKLQKERYNARLSAAQVQVQAVQAGSGSQHDLGALIVLLAADAAALETKPADRVKWYQLRVDRLREEEQMARERSKAGAASPTAANLATAARADAEIELLQFKDSLKGGK